jgi:4-carboxymuconolactone decarboxylase
MARVSYVEEKDHPELAAEIAKIKGGRGRLINVYKLLLHTPTVCMAWFEHIGAIRWKTKLPPRLREIAIVRIASAVKYAYALQQHVPGIAVPDGVSLEECEALKDWKGSKFFSEAERAALAYVDAMIAAPEVPDDVFNAVRKHYSEREVVELTILAGTYIMHNRVTTALRIDLEPAKN